MLFAAEMGLGLVLWGVAEPLNHYETPMRVDPMGAAAQEAIRFSFLLGPASVGGMVTSGGHPHCWQIPEGAAAAILLLAGVLNAL